MPTRFVLAPARPDLAKGAARRNFLGRVLAVASGGILLGRASKAVAAPTATQASEPFIGEIAMVGFNFAPVGWALCNGQLLAISQNTALFSLLGTTYGGNGMTTFALPDLRGRLPMHMGGSHPLGNSGGEEVHLLTTGEIPAHAHTVMSDSSNGTSPDPDGRYPARNPAGIPVYGPTAGAAMGVDAMSIVGGGQPHNNLPPYLTINFIIALQGLFPSQS